MIRADGYEELRKAIVSGDLLPGERLLEEDLSARLGLGGAAVRMALARLEQPQAAELAMRCHVSLVAEALRSHGGR